MFSLSIMVPLDDYRRLAAGESIAAPELAPWHRYSQSPIWVGAYEGVAQRPAIPCQIGYTSNGLRLLCLRG